MSDEDGAKKCPTCGGSGVVVWEAGERVTSDPFPNCTTQRYIPHDEMLKIMREEE